MTSMTGYGRASVVVGDGSYRVELRTVNSRFLDIKLKLPWSDAEIETKATALVRGRLARGRVELSVWEERAAAEVTSLRLNTPLAQQLADVLRQLAQLLQTDVPTAASLLPRMPELIAGAPVAADSERLWQALCAGVQRALDALVQMREREGAALQRDLSTHLERMVAIVDQVQQLISVDPQRIRDALLARLARLMDSGDLDAGRLAQEAALLADRADVSEELARLRSHSDQLRDMLRQGGPVGRKADFMLQELNRELNTVSAKTVNTEVSALMVEAKGCVEKMREQAQNVE